jgi:hypothetical protein
MRAYASWLHGAALFAAAVACLPGCGAKTGLEVPDASRDSGRDAGVDAAPMRDASMDASIPCFELDPDGGPLDLPLDTEVQVGRADVVFLIDITGSMDQEIDRIQSDLRDQISPGIQEAIPDSQIGVATLADFPEGSCGVEGEDSPFRLVLPVTDDLARVQSAVNSIATSNGGDPPESQVEALFQTATGQGIGSYVAPSFGCPRGGFGYPCFREDALPVILLFTDDEFHNGPSGSNDYGSFGACSPSPSPHTYRETRDALTDRGIRVMGLFSGTAPSARNEMEQIARDTGALDSGRPLVFDIGRNGEGLSAGVVDSIRTLASVIQFDIDTLLVDPDPRDGVDPRDFVESVIPLRAEPMDGVESIDVAAGVFRGVHTGTRVVFQLRLRNGVVAPGVGPQHFTLEIVFRGDGRTRITSRLIDIVVPGADGSGCPR